MEEYRHDSCADKGCRASVIKKHRIDNDVKTVDVHATGSLENRRKEREHAHVQASKTLKDMHTKLMTPQLILSAVTSTLAAKTIYRPCRTNSDGGRCDCMYGTRRDHNFVESSTLSRRHSVAAKRYGSLYRHLGSVNTIDAYDLELHVEMTSLEFDHIADLAPHCEKFKQPFSIGVSTMIQDLTTSALRTTMEYMLAQVRRSTEALACAVTFQIDKHRIRKRNTTGTS
jgi:hypothetical protein